jgi:hypothetical protein
MKDQGFLDNVAAPNRRQFAGSLVAAATSLLLPAAAAAADKAPDNTKAEDSAIDPELRRLRPEGFSDADWNEVQARYSNLLRVYGERLSSEEKRRTVRILITNQHMLVSVRSFVVQNGDPSACTLRLYDPEQQASTAGKHHRT